MLLQSIYNKSHTQQVNKLLDLNRTKISPKQQFYKKLIKPKQSGNMKLCKTSNETSIHQNKSKSKKLKIKNVNHFENSLQKINNLFLDREKLNRCMEKFR